jgi:drug/metabolite transporter (DMT)-like permease
MSATTIGPVRLTPWLGYAYAIAVVLIWAGFSLSGRHAALTTGVRLTPWDLGALRHLVSGVIAAGLWLAGVGRGLRIERSFVMGVLAGLAFPLPSYVGFTFAPAAHGAVVLSGTLPFLVGVGTWAVYGERWTRARSLSLVLLLGGMLLLGYEAYVQGARPGAWRGDLLFLVSSIAWAAYTILARRWRASPGQAVIAVGLWCPALYLPIWAMFLPSTIARAPIGEIVFQAVFQGLVATVVSLVFFTRALAVLGPARLTTITALVPGVAGLLAIPLLGEHMEAAGLTGLGLVCAAVAVGVYRRRD